MSAVQGRKAAGFASAALLIALVTIAARVFGFGRWLVFSPTVGSGGVGTAYQSANQLPNVLFEVAAGGALAGAIVPLLAGPIARGAAHEASKIASALLTWTITLLLPLSALLALLAGPLTNALVPGNQVPGTVALSTRLLIVFAPQVVLYGIGVVLTGVLQAHRRFLWPAFVPLLSSAVVMAAYIIYNQVSGEPARRRPISRRPPKPGSAGGRLPESSRFHYRCSCRRAPPASGSARRGSFLPASLVVPRIWPAPAS